MRTIATMVLVAVAMPAAAQEPAKPGPEHDLLRKLVGTWDTTLKAGGTESKGTMTYKMGLGGLWLVGDMESDFGGQKFTGHSLDTYDAGKKRYVGVWADSMSTAPLVMDGGYDAGKRTLTMTGDGPGPDGKPAKFRGVTEIKDDDTLEFAMFMGDGKEPAFTITYKRRK